MFLAVATVSTLLHVDRVDAGPAFVFLYGFLSPLVVYVAVFRLWPGGHAQTMFSFLVGIGLLQFLVIAVLQLPTFLSDGDPDGISGTFGENPYQLVFFLNVFNALVAGAALFQPRRWTGRLAPLLLLGSALVIFLAQYRALMVTTFLSLVLVGALVSVVRPRALHLHAACPDNPCRGVLPDLVRISGEQARRGGHCLAGGPVVLRQGAPVSDGGPGGAVRRSGAGDSRHRSGNLLQPGVAYLRHHRGPNGRRRPIRQGSSRGASIGPTSPRSSSSPGCNRRRLFRGRSS